MTSNDDNDLCKLRAMPSYQKSPNPMEIISVARGVFNKVLLASKGRKSIPFSFNNFSSWEVAERDFILQCPLPQIVR